MNDADTLDAKDWHRLNALLRDALELDAAARRDWLATLPPEAQDLRPILERLLAAGLGDGTSQTLQPVVQMASAAMAAMRREQPGDRVGPWQLERLLAEGGMGAVWLARRADGLMQRSAALKLPRAEWIDHGLSERIARERAILARLQHPWIAVLYDAGLGVDGRPYLALEYVDGRSIDAWCAGRELRDTVRLYVQVVRAVAYAHSQLVIHRDIKPSNVLVTADGVPKLLDFGISKLLEGDAPAAAETALTRQTGRALTLAYAAPEQVLGEPVGATADVYALGVLLFELLAGTRLYRAQEPRALEAEVLAGELRAPSAAAPDRARGRQLRGDLDAVVATALKREPVARYRSAVALADDLERWLAGEPVRAQPDSLAYRLRKYLARNRLPVAAGGTVVLALAAGLGLALWQAGVAGEQARRATALNDFVLSLIRQADPNASRETKAADVAMLAAIERRIDTEFQGSPDQLLQLRITVGDAYKNRGEMMAARRVFQRAVDDAAPRLPADDLRLLAAQVRASDVTLIVSNAASEQLDRAIALLRPRADRDPAAAELLIDALLNRNELQFYYGVPAFAPAERRFDTIKEAHALALRHFGAGSRQHLRSVPAFDELAAVMDKDGGHDILQEALEQAQRRGDEVAGGAEYLRVTALHAARQCQEGRRSEGAAILRNALAQARTAHGANSLQVELLLAPLSACGEEAGRRAAADAYEIAAARERPPSTHLMRRAERALGWAMDRQDWTAAERYYRSALENAEAIPEPELRHALTKGLRTARVCLLARRGDTDEAIRNAAPIRAELDAIYAELGRITPGDGDFWTCLSDAQRMGGRAADAEQTAQIFLDRCLATMKTAPGLACSRLALNALALARLELGKLAEAQAAIEQRLALRRDLSDPNLALAYGRVLLATGRTAEAVEVLRENHGRWLSTSASGTPAAEAMYWFGRALLATGDPRGKPMIEQARQRLSESRVAMHRKLAADQAIH